MFEIVNNNDLKYRLIQQKKKAVVITARVHPGETPSSWMMKGFMDYLTGDSNQARELREKFIFKLVPMLNPDGVRENYFNKYKNIVNVLCTLRFFLSLQVIVGNNRCSLTGKDLNRQYRTVIRETYPPVWHTKVMIRRLVRRIQLSRILLKTLRNNYLINYCTTDYRKNVA